MLMFPNSEPSSSKTNQSIICPFVSIFYRLFDSLYFLSTGHVSLHQRFSEIAYLGYKGRKARKALRDEAFRWTNKTVPYEIEDGVSNRTRNRVTDATNHWMKYTCILFPPRQGQSKYVYIRDNQRCESLRGMQHFMPGRQNLHVNGCPGLEEVIHEIGHTIGFAHEHSRPDRDEYVDIHISQAGDHNFDKLDELEINTFDLPYDYRSVMHYGPDYMTARDKDFQDKIGPGKRYGLSFLDIKLANLMYKCDEGCKPRPPCPDEGYVGKDCQCYCERDSWLADPIELCNLLRVLQVKYIRPCLIASRFILVVRGATTPDRFKQQEQQEMTFSVMLRLSWSYQAPCLTFLEGKSSYFNSNNILANLSNSWVDSIM